MCGMKKGLDKKSIYNRRILVTAAALTMQFCVGILYFWSLLSEAVQIEFGLLQSSANLVQPLMMFGFVFGNLIGGYAQDKTNPRLIAFIGALMCSGGITLTFFVPIIGLEAAWLIFVTFGIAGLGCGAVYASIVSLLQKWYPNRRGLASGMSAAAFVATAIPLSPLLNWAVSAGAAASQIFLVYGLLTLGINLVCCIFIRPPKTENASAEITAATQTAGCQTKAATTLQAIDCHPAATISPAADHTTPITNLKPIQALGMITFWNIFIFILLFNSVFNVLMPTMFAFGGGYPAGFGEYSGRGLSGTQLATLLALVAVFNLSGRLIMGFVSDKIGRQMSLIIIACLTGLGAFGLIWAQGVLFIAMVLIIAFAFGGGAAMFPPMIIEFAGKKYAATIFGMVLLPLGISSIVFVAIHNALYSRTGGYTATMALVAAVNIVPFVLMLLYKKFVAFDNEKIGNKRKNDK